MKDNNPDEIRHCLGEIERRTHYEMSNVSWLAAWPMISELIVAVNYAEPDMRGLALRHFSDKLVKSLGETRRRLNATNDWLDHLNKTAAPARLRALGE
jgi:hypothetical protein